jgi:ribosomal protein S18 acetylase RimI-like enzyme
VGDDHDVIGLRVLTPDDWRVWRRVRLAALAEAPYAFGSRLEDWEERWRARLSIPGSYHLAAEIDGEVVGVAGGVPTPYDGVVELISMWVRPDARGRGVGDALIEAVEEWARRTGATTVRLAVAEGNDRAEALYRRHGYRRTGEVDRMPDGVRREFVMAKPLDSAPGGR